MKKLIIVALFIANANALEFYKPAEAKSTIEASDAVCVYLANGYRPVTKLAVEAVKATGNKTCNDKAEAYLYSKHNKTFIKHNKRTLGEGRYNEIKKLYYQFLAK